MISVRAGAAAAAVALAASLWLAIPRGQTQTTSWVERVNARPRLLFAPGEFERFGAETAGTRRAAFDDLLAHIDARGTRGWNERDIQLESQALAARVLLDRGEPRGSRVLGYARNSLRFFLDTHTYHRWSDSHAIVTEGGRWIEAVALAHDWLHPRWSPEDRAAIEQWLGEELEHWMTTNRLVRASASPFRNDAARGVAALVLAGLTLFDVPAYADTARRALDHARPFYEAILRAHVHAGLGGGMAEGTFYGNFTAWSQTLLAEALFTGAGLRDAYTRTPFYAARLQYATHAGWPGYLTNQFRFNVHQLAPVFGDARRGPTGSALYHRATVLLLAKRFPGRAAAREAYWVVNREETSKPYTREWALYDVLFWSPDIQPQQPTALAYHEPSLGQVFARSAWTDDATWMSFNAGPHLDTHQHYDAGNLTIFRSVDLLVDSGSLDAFGSNHWYNYYARTVAHNTITVTDPQERWDGIWGGVPDALAVNDGGQRTAAPLTPAPTLDEYLGNRVAYDHGRIERYGEGSWGVYVGADLTNAYQNPSFQSARPNGSRNRPKVTHVGREVLYLRGQDTRRDTFVVFDRVVSTDPAFRKAVLWHAREPFETRAIGRRIDEGEIRYEGEGRYDFQTLVSFNQGPRRGRGRLFVTALAVDPIVVRQIGRREPSGGVDHTTFNIGHRHRHIKDYFIEDPRGLTNPQQSTGAFGRPEWPPFNPPEQQWLFNDDLAGGWGQTRLEVQPANARQPDRFLTVLVPSDDAAAAPPAIEAARAVDGGAVGLVIRDGARPEVVMLGADARGADLKRGTIDVPLQGRAADLTVVTLTPGGRYLVRLGEGGGVQRIAVMALANGGVAADQAGVLRVKLDDLPRMPLGAGAGVLPAPSSGVAALDAPSDNAAAFEALGYELAQTPGERPHPGLVTVNATSPEDLATWEPRVAQMLRRGDLRLRETTADSLAPGRTHQRLAQMYKGVPVFGGDLSRQIENKQTASIFGTLYENIALDPVPRLTTAEAAEIFARLSGRSLGPARSPELIVLPTDDGRYVLTFRARLATRDDVVMTFIDANTGEEVLRFSDLKRPVF